jgi:hypothetical protein
MCISLATLHRLTSRPFELLCRYALGDLMELAGFSLLESSAADTRITGIQTKPYMVRPPGTSFGMPTQHRPPQLQLRYSCCFRSASLRS